MSEFAVSAPVDPAPSHVSSASDVSGRLIVVTGPSGVGKGTLLAQLRDRHPELQVSISATTRSPRPGEIDGQHYYFYARDRFIELRERGEFLEWAEYAGNLYGTPMTPVQQTLATGRDVLLEIEVEGARQVARCWPDALRVFVVPPSLDELERRIRDRGQDDEASIHRRMETAQVELQAAPEFDVTIVNDRLDRALAALDCLLFDPEGTQTSRLT